MSIILLKDKKSGIVYPKGYYTEDGEYLLSFSHSLEDRIYRYPEGVILLNRSYKCGEFTFNFIKHKILTFLTKILTKNEGKIMNVLSLFDGISCGQIALNRAGVGYDNYYASEIDKYAIKVTQFNYPSTIQLGDVNNWRDWNLDWKSIDLLIGGSPCQGFSFAGKQIAFDDPRSKLFFKYKEILDHVIKLNPSVKFLLENVRMKKEFLQVITDQLGIEPVFIDSQLISAQMRKRYYWFNWDFVTPADKHILLADIITSGSVEKEKSWCVLESWNRFPKKLQSVIGRYGRCMMPVVFTEKSCKFEDGWRPLNITEVERLQTVPEGYCSCVSDTVGMGLLGNGWTVDVIVEILKPLIKPHSKA